MVSVVENLWFDENGKEYKLVANYFVPVVDSNKCILYGVFSDGTSMPMHELKQKFKQKNKFYLKKEEK